MRVRQLLCLIGMAVGLSLPTAVRAADILPVQSGLPCHIRLVGLVTTGDAKRIESIVNKGEDRRPIKIEDSSEHSTAICLDSPGGSYVEGLQIMNLLRDKGIGGFEQSSHDLCAVSCLAAGRSKVPRPPCSTAVPLHSTTESAA